MFTDEERKRFEECLAKEYGGDVFRMARTTDNPLYQRFVLSSHGVGNVVECALAQNSSLDSKLQMLLAGDTDVEIREYLAMNEGLCIDAQKILSKDPEISVWFALCTNRNLDPSVRYGMATQVFGSSRYLKIPMYSGCGIDGERMRVFFYPKERTDIKESLISKYGTFIIGDPMDIEKIGKDMSKSLSHFESSFVYFDGKVCHRPQMGCVLSAGLGLSEYNRISSTLTDLKNYMYMAFNFVKIQNGHAAKDFKLNVGEDSVFLLQGGKPVMGMRIDEYGHFSVSTGSEEHFMYALDAYRTEKVDYCYDIERELNSLDSLRVKAAVMQVVFKECVSMGYNLQVDLNRIQQLGFGPIESKRGVDTVLEDVSDYLKGLKVHLGFTPDLQGNMSSLNPRGEGLSEEETPDLN